MPQWDGTDDGSVQQDPWAATGDPWGGGGATPSQPSQPAPAARPEVQTPAPEDPWAAVERPGGSPEVGGVYVDSHGTVQATFTLLPNGSLAGEYPGWPADTGTFDGSTVNIAGMVGKYRDGSITWQNGRTWTRRGADGSQAWSGAPAARSSDSSANAGSAQPYSHSRQPAESAARSWGAATNGWDATSTAAAPAQWGDPVNRDAAEEEWRAKQREKKQRELAQWQSYNLSKNIPPGPSHHEDPSRLFRRGTMGVGEGFKDYDKVPCDISGLNSKNMPELVTFDQLYVEFKQYVPEVLQQNIQYCGYESPTPVQKFSIPAGLVGRDIMCCAQTGSGKTVAFLIPCIANMIMNERGLATSTIPHQGPCKPNTLIISPTRELLLQIYDEALKLCYGTQFRCIRIYGKEQNIKAQMEDLAKGADLMVATPGRLWDLVDAGVVDVSKTACLVLDEADRMLKMGSEWHIREVVEKHRMPDKENRQTLMFSATFPEECQTLAMEYLFDYLWIGVGVIGGAVNTVSQEFEQVAPEDKYDRLVDKLHEILESRKEGERILVFTNSKMQAKGLDEQLFNSHFDTGALHGDLEQHEREANLEKFRTGAIDVMIATDLASRGLDIHGVGYVINYDLPAHEDAKYVYVQRIGRTGRIGHLGQAITFLAVDKQGNWLDDTEMVAALPTILQDSGENSAAHVPDWLKTKAEEIQATSTSWADKKKWNAEGTENTSWSTWAQKDMRETNGDWQQSNGGGWSRTPANDQAAPQEQSWEPFTAAAHNTASGSGAWS